MKIVSHPYQATIVPQPARKNALWRCVIHREGSPEVLAQMDAATKEDACCAANLEILRLKRNSSALTAEAGSSLRNAS